MHDCIYMYKIMHVMKHGRQSINIEINNNYNNYIITCIMIPPADCIIIIDCIIIVITWLVGWKR